MKCCEFANVAVAWHAQPLDVHNRIMVDQGEFIWTIEGDQVYQNCFYFRVLCNCIHIEKVKGTLSASNEEKLVSPKFKMSHFLWQLEAYPSGKEKSKSSELTHSFDLFLRLLSLPHAFAEITILRAFKCKETLSGFVSVSTFKKGQSFGWPQFNQSRQDLVNRLYWTQQIQFRINIKILIVRLHKNNSIFYENLLDPFKALKERKIRWDISESLLHEM